MSRLQTHRWSQNLWFAVAVAVAVAAALLALAGPARALSPDPRTLPLASPDVEGLQRQSTSKVDEFYLRPGASFSTYKQVLLAPVEVSFARLWERQHREVDARESVKIRGELARLARDEFTRQLQRKDGYTVVGAPGPDVLEVRASIVNLDIYAPDVPDSSVRRNYVLKAGEATLVAELRDSQTGALLGRVVDRREMREYPEFTLATSVTNSGDARELVGLWSRMLRRYLDTARADGKGP
jgi:hypothetical protein